MKALTFTYKKTTGELSERFLLALSQPGNKYSGIDITELQGTPASEEFVRLAKQLHDKYVMDMQRLQQDFDLKHNYRQFLESGMTDVTQI